jgi:DNA-binding MarR family transcriptional regulator
MMQIHHCAPVPPAQGDRAITRIYDARLASHGVNVNQFAMLRHIARAGDIALSRLAAQLVMDRTTLYRVLRPVEQAGWVETFPEAKGRGRRVRLTAGEKPCWQGRLPIGRRVRTMFAPIWAMMAGTGSMRPVPQCLLWKGIDDGARDCARTRDRGAGGDVRCPARFGRVRSAPAS